MVKRSLTAKVLPISESHPLRGIDKVTTSGYGSVEGGNNVIVLNLLDVKLVSFPWDLSGINIESITLENIDRQWWAKIRW